MAQHTFISYSRQDQEFALKLAGDLRQSGANIWMDQFDIGPGQDWDIAVENALYSCESFLFILSPESVKSKDVRDELNLAISEGKRIIPVLHKSCKIPLRIHRIQYIDFTTDYDLALTVLLKALAVSHHSQEKTPSKPVEQAESKLKDDKDRIRKTEEEKKQKAEKERKHKAEEVSRKPSYSLRSSLVKELSAEAVKKMLQEKGFFDKRNNERGKGIAHQYQVKDINGDKVVIDDATGLTWQQSGSSNYMNYDNAKKYIDQLNRDSFAGYDDWRLPTLEEGMSLMEPEKSSNGLPINPLFDKTQRWIWTSDLYSASAAWVVYFGRGGCDVDDGSCFVRAVRSGYSLRSSLVKELSGEAVKKMLQEKGFFDKRNNERGKGTSHQYQAKDVNGNKVVIDQATGLMWQQAGSDNAMRFENAKKYIDQLNRDKFAGYSDWRLPMLEEAMSLMEPTQKNGDLYIDPVFDAEQSYIWTSDLSSASRAWYVYFDLGSCDDLVIRSISGYVRAVRSPKGQAGQSLDHY